MKRWFAYTFVFVAVFTAAWTYSVRTAPERRRRAMSDALSKDDPAAVRRLLDEGGDPVFQSEFGDSPLSVFTAAKDYEGMERVLRAGADPNSLAPRGGSMFQVAIEAFDARAAELLLRAGADPNGSQLDDDRPLLLVFHGQHSEAERYELIQLLCEYGVDIDAREDYLGTALRAAVVYDEPKIARYLIQKGANPRLAPPDGGDDPLTVALGNGYGRKPHLVRLLRAALAKQPPLRRRLWESIKRGDVRQLISCLSEGADVNSCDTGGRTLLHAAIEKERLDLVRVLLQHKADIEARDAVRLTPLMVAAKSGQLNVVQLLICLGANAKALDAGGRTASDLAKPGSEVMWQLHAAEQAAGEIRRDAK